MPPKLSPPGAEHSLQRPSRVKIGEDKWGGAGVFRVAIPEQEGLQNDHHSCGERTQRQTTDDRRSATAAHRSDKRNSEREQREESPPETTEAHHDSIATSRAQAEVEHEERKSILHRSIELPQPAPSATRRQRSLPSPSDNRASPAVGDENASSHETTDNNKENSNVAPHTSSLAKNTSNSDVAGDRTCAKPNGKAGSQPKTAASTSVSSPIRSPHSGTIRPSPLWPSSCPTLHHVADCMCEPCRRVRAKRKTAPPARPTFRIVGSVPRLVLATLEAHGFRREDGKGPRRPRPGRRGRRVGSAQWRILWSSQHLRQASSSRIRPRMVDTANT